MKKRIFKLYVVPGLYVLSLLAFVSGMYLFQRTTNNDIFSELDEIEYVDKEIVTDNEYIPVVSLENTIMKPFLKEDIIISKSFYDPNGDSESQESAIIFYENTYIQNSGIDYKYNESFDIISILDGTVIDVTDNELLGKTIKIKHNNDLISTYQSLEDVTIKKDDIVLRGQVIAKSGKCKLYSNDYNLHFELSHQGKNINPEEYYNKRESEL